MDFFSFLYQFFKHAFHLVADFVKKFMHHIQEKLKAGDIGLKLVFNR